MHVRRSRRHAAIAAAALTLVLIVPVPGARASHLETVLFTAMADNTLSTDIVTSAAAVPIQEGVPEVFHSFGSQAAEFPAGFETVQGPFNQPGEPFDVVQIAATAHMSAPSSAHFTFLVKNGTTNELITEFTANTVNLDDIPLDDAFESDPPGDHCPPPDLFDPDPHFKAVEFQITLAPPVNQVVVGPNHDVQLILTPQSIFGGSVELCVEDSFFYTALGLVIEPFPSPPVATDDMATTPKNTPVTICALCNDSDADNDPLSVTNLTQPANGSAGLNPGGTVTYTPDPGFVGTDSFTYTANDGTDDGNVATVTVEVFNQPPVATDDTAMTLKNTPVVVAVLANDSDPDGDPLSVTNLTTPANGSTMLNADGTVTYAPNAGFSGFDAFTYTANDGMDDGNVATVTVEVINRPPDCSAAVPSLTTLWPPNKTFHPVGVLGVTDPDGDPVTITIDGIRQDEPTGVLAPDGQGVGTATALLRAERDGDGDGRVYHETFTADDGDGGTCTQTVRVGVSHDQGNGLVPVDGGPIHDSTV